jgi:CheY-like chemotaxis protein
VTHPPVVLVVEDEELLQLVIHDGLKDGGFDVRVVASAREALALLQSELVKYSALVTDINLADGYNGWDVARQAREIDPSLAVVYATSAFRWRMESARSPQQHSHGQALCAGTTRDRRVPTLEHRRGYGLKTIRAVHEP